jgi:DNA-binding SARP family transcriptional activator
MDIVVLGPVDVTEMGVAVMPSAPKPRQVLALLALRADQVVSVDTLVEELWDGAPPRSARTTLQTYVVQLRDLIAAALPVGDPRTAKDVLCTTHGGYLLNTWHGSCDFAEFERRAGLGYRAMDAGDFAGAARQLREALALWSGSALADVQHGPSLEAHRKRLEEVRLCALDQRIDADLRLGRHRELLGELTVLVSRYRTHENLHGQFMLALHRSGRRSEALEVYQRLRTALVRERGLEPSAALRRLQRSILVTCPEPVNRPAPAGAARFGGQG